MKSIHWQGGKKNSHNKGSGRGSRGAVKVLEVRGQEAVQLTFSVRNRTETPRAVLLVLRGCVIGGHLTDGIYGSEPSALVI